MSEPESQSKSKPESQQEYIPNQNTPWYVRFLLWIRKHLAKFPKFLLKMGKFFSGASRFFVTYGPPINYFTDPLAFSLDLIGGAAQATALWIDPSLEEESRKEKQATSWLRSAAGLVGLVGAIGILGAGAVVAAPILIVAGAVGVFISNCLSCFRAYKEYKSVMKEKPASVSDKFATQEAYDQAMASWNHKNKLWNLKREAKEQQLMTTGLGVFCSLVAGIFAVAILTALPVTFPVVVVLGIVGVISAFSGWKSRKKEEKVNEKLEIEMADVDKKGQDDHKVLTDSDTMVITETPKEWEDHFKDLKKQYRTREETWPPKEGDHLFDPLETEKAKHNTHKIEKIPDPKKEDKEKQDDDEDDDKGEDKFK